MIIPALQFIGTHARVILPAGIIVALLLPEHQMRWDIILPAIITFIYAASFIRLDLKQSFRDAFRLHSLVISISLSALILCMVPLGYTGLARLFGLDQIFMPSLVWFAVAPPIASTVWMCAMLGFRAALAMEIVLITSLAAPFTGPFMASLVLQDIAVIEPLPLFFRLAMMIFGGGVIAYFGQKMLGRETIEAQRKSFDGLSALAMMIFLIPVFNGMGRVIIADLWLAFYFLLLAGVMNAGIQIVIMVCASFSSSATIRAVGDVMAVVTGNRNVGLYFAALPPDPAFALFTAIYQVPLYLSPLMLGGLASLLQRRTRG